MHRNDTYKVQLWEYERGFGQRHFDTKEFDDFIEAIDYADKVNSRNNLNYTPDTYIIAKLIIPYGQEFTT